MNATATSARPGGLTQDQMLGQLAASPDYRVPVGASAARFADAAHALFGGKLQPLMASAGAAGRFAGLAGSLLMPHPGGTHRRPEVR